MDGIYGVLDAILPMEAYRFGFMKNALLAVLLLTPMLGLLGTMAVNHQMAFFSDALGHSALTGIGLGIILGLRNDLLAMLIFGVVWAISICLIKQSGSASTDTIISVFSSTSVAAGLLILARGGQFAKYSSLLIGDILAVTPQDLLYLLAALIVTVGLWIVLYNALLMTSVDPMLAKSRGIATRAIECGFVMLINALLILPAAAGRNLARTSRQHAAWSVGIAMLSGIAGLILSYYLDTSAGATIVLVSAACYAASLLIRGIRK